MRIVIIGAVAAGTSAAAKARRNTEDAEIVVYEKDSIISYSGCGMPYYLGGDIVNADELTPRDPVFFKSKYNVDIFTQHEVLSINADKKKIEVNNLITGDVFTDTYDKLVVSTGASAIVPKIKGVQLSHVFNLRNINDMNRIKTFIDKVKPKKAVIVGSGFIGLELCDNFKKLGIEITLIEKLKQVTPSLDSDMSFYVKNHLAKNGITVLTGTSLTEITENKVVLSNGTTIDTQLVILTVGVQPNIRLAKESGIEIGVTGAIKVDRKMKTNKEDIYACGDCSQQYSLITGKPVYRPMGSTANKTGRITGDIITGGDLEFRGILGTSIFRIFDLTVAQTGLSEKEAKEQGFDTVICHNIKPNKPVYMGGREIVIKGVADKNTGKLLGVQIVGDEGVDKRIDVFATAITFGAKVEDLFHLDLAYAPPFSTTKDPVMYTGMILDNAINHGRKLITANELEDLKQSGQELMIIDTRVPSQYDRNLVEDARNIPHAKIRESIKNLDQNTITITYCNKGVTGNAVQNILLNKGFNEVYNLSGGHKQYRQSKE